MTSTDPEQTTAVATVSQAQAPVLIFGSDDPVAIVKRVGDVAKALGDFIRAHGMAKRLESSAAAAKREERGDPPPKEYVFIDGWSFAGQMLGIAGVVREVRDLRDDEGRWYGAEARVELITRQGLVVGGALAECTRYEDRWNGREPFQIKSMAQTRAIGKAFRTGFGFVMVAAGYEATPAEEFVEERDDAAPREYGPPRGQGRPARGQQQQRPQQQTTQRRHGVARMDEPKDVGQLIQACRYWLGYSGEDVLSALAVETVSAIAPRVSDGWGGNFRAALEAIVAAAVSESAVLPPEWQEAAQDGPEAAEPAEAAPVGAK